MQQIESHIPNHLVIIPDGDRRWARQRGLQPWEGHEEGAKNLQNLTDFCFQQGITCLSAWGSSLDNLTKRPLPERLALFDVYQKYFSKLLNDERIVREEVRVTFIGRWRDHLPASLIELIDEIIQRTGKFHKRNLNFMLAYDGIDEMTSAIEDIAREVQGGTAITQTLVKQHLMTKDLPPVDLLIRTGGEPHLSGGFMMWDTANTQLYFSDINFPDFNEQELAKALAEYSRRERRFGT